MVLPVMRVRQSVVPSARRQYRCDAQQQGCLRVIEAGQPFVRVEVLSDGLLTLTRKCRRCGQGYMQAVQYRSPVTMRTVNAVLGRLQVARQVLGLFGAPGELELLGLDVVFRETGGREVDVLRPEELYHPTEGAAVKWEGVSLSVVQKNVVRDLARFVAKGGVFSLRFKDALPQAEQEVLFDLQRQLGEKSDAKQ